MVCTGEFVNGLVDGLELKSTIKSKPGQEFKLKIKEKSLKFTSEHLRKVAMSELKNNTPFAATYVLLPNVQGIDTIYVNVKASFNLGKSWTLCDEQTPPFFQDVYWGEPGFSSIKFPTAIHQGKPATDIGLLATACAPDHKLVRQLDVSASVGMVQKTLRVFGDRVWDRGRVSSATEFVQMPLVYENAFGGQYWKDNQLVDLETRNPLGKGFKGERSQEEMNGSMLPNIENPTQLIGSVDDSPAPSGFGFIASNWHPRFLYAGTYDEQWKQNRAPYLPLDYQPRFQNSAHPDLVSGGYLTGGEEVTLTNMHPGGPINFIIPHIVLSGKVQFHGQISQSLQFVMETLIVDVDNERLTLDWKASCLCNNALPLLRSITINLVR